jgi:hypothetical protein
MSVLLQVIVSSHLILAADKIPELDYAPSCRGAAQAAALQNRNEDACLQDEKAAKAKLQEDWSSFSPQDKAHCVRLSRTGGFPSYVELLTCVEMSKAAANLPAGARQNKRIER